MKVEFHPAAARELIETSTFYDNEVLGLGERFVAEVERVVSLVAEPIPIERRALTRVFRQRRQLAHLLVHRSQAPCACYCPNGKRAQ